MQKKIPPIILPKNCPFLVGLTGGVATGKSTASEFLRDLNVNVICADEISHDLTQKNATGYKKIIKEFGKDILTNTKELDRPKLADLVFTNQNAKKKLEAILHPLIRKKTSDEIKRLQKAGHKIIVLDVPLLFESGWNQICDLNICIAAPQKLQIERLKKSRGWTRTQSLARLKNQWPLKKKIAFSHFTIHNAGSKKELLVNLKFIFEVIQKMFPQKS